MVDGMAGEGPDHPARMLLGPDGPGLGPDWDWAGLGPDVVAGLAAQGRIVAGEMGTVHGTCLECCWVE